MKRVLLALFALSLIAGCGESEKEKQAALQAEAAAKAAAEQAAKEQETEKAAAEEKRKIMERIEAAKRESERLRKEGELLKKKHSSFEAKFARLRELNHISKIRQWTSQERQEAIELANDINKEYGTSIQIK